MTQHPAFACNATSTAPDFIRGDTVNLEFCFTNEDCTAWGDIAGWRLVVVFKKNESDTEPVLIVDYLVPSGDLATASKAVVAIKSTETAALCPGKFYYEYKRVLTLVPLDVWTIDSGSFRVTHGTDIAQFLK